jgi:hypothetical protein
VGGTDRWDEVERSAFAPVASSVAALRSSPATAGEIDGGTRSSADWQFHVAEGTNVQVGDRLVDDGTAETFLLRGVERRQGPPGSSINHVRLLAERVEPGVTTP